ncbi:MAG: HAD family hydrolase [Cytophagales bacterium]|nr:MAG: HAD family hydrolase [Cytophagales bacterium]
MKKTIAFDADDTLWHNESIFHETTHTFMDLVSHYVSASELEERLYAVERRNLALFGYGIKGFMLSMIETVIELSEGKATGTEIQQVIDLGKYMLTHPINVLEDVEETVSALKDDYRLMVITKGDLLDQESKIARSGLADYFELIEIVSEKDEKTYTEVLKRNKIDINQFLMVGNSLKSDILPICTLGGKAVHIPYHLNWELDKVEKSYDFNEQHYATLSSVALLPLFLEEIDF